MATEEEEAMLRDAEASLLALQQEMEGLLQRGPELEEGAFRRELKELEVREQAAIRLADDALEECEVVVEDLADAGGAREAEEAAALEKALAASKATCTRRRTALRSARVAAHQQLADRAKEQRNALLDGASVRRRVTVGGDPEGMSAEEEKKNKAAATMKLRQMKAEMAAETERAAEALQLFADSTGTLGSTNAKQENVARGADKAGELVAELERREKRDRQMIHGAFGTFVGVVIYVVAKRLPFLGHFICAYAPRQFC
jgi:hypothetical protein